MTQRVYYGTYEPDPEPTPAEVGPPDDVHTVKWGYNLADLDILTRRAIAPIGAAHLYTTAWDGVVDVLLAADSRPTPGQLVIAGRYAVRAERYKVAAEYGTRSDGTRMATFAAYWRVGRGADVGFEDRIVERLALWQIWPTLRPAYRRAMLAMASTDCDKARSADLLGLAPAGLASATAGARNQFLASWHEGETPARSWRWSNRKPPTSKWTVEKVEVIRDRYQAGETLMALAVEYGTSTGVLSKLLRGKIRPRETEAA